MPDYNAPNNLPFQSAATPAQPKTTVSLQLDADIVAWFQKQAEGGGMPWQQDMNGVLRFYMESNEALLSGPEPEKVPLVADWTVRRKAAEEALINRHADEYEDVHNGSGCSEEMPSDLDARHREEWEAFERAWAAPPTAPAPGTPSPK